MVRKFRFQLHGGFTLRDWLGLARSIHHVRPGTISCHVARYIKCLYVYNKVDMISIEDMDRLAREPNSIVVSVHMKLNLEALLVSRIPLVGGPIECPGGQGGGCRPAAVLVRRDETQRREGSAEPAEAVSEKRYRGRGGHRVVLVLRSARLTTGSWMDGAWTAAKSCLWFLSLPSCNGVTGRWPGYGLPRRMYCKGGVGELNGGRSQTLVWPT